MILLAKFPVNTSEGVSVRFQGAPPAPQLVRTTTTEEASLESKYIHCPDCNEWILNCTREVLQEELFRSTEYERMLIRQHMALCFRASFTFTEGQNREMGLSRQKLQFTAELENIQNVAKEISRSLAHCSRKCPDVSPQNFGR